MHNFLILYPTGLLNNNMHKIQQLLYLAHLCLDSMSINVCRHIFNSGFAYKDINNFLSNNHIWNQWNLNGHISQIQ